MTLEELQKIKEETLPSLEQRITHYKTSIYVATGDSGLKNGSRLALQAILNEVYDLGLKNVMVTQMPALPDTDGYEPVVQVTLENGETFLYGRVSAELGKQIVSKHVVGKKAITEFLLENLKKEEK